tara:strand:+ start:254 stop:1243 length:990 start_codon:yes stop_codon:yes gene_type:complete
MEILITGSAGLIASPLCHKLILNGHSVIGIDSFINSNSINTNMLKIKFPKKFKFFEIDLSLDSEQLVDILYKYKPCIVIHLAALKSIEDSMRYPEKYWKNNIKSTFNILDAMKKAGCKNLIYSSSAAVYGNQENQPIKEDTELKPISTYGETKLECEKLVTMASKKDDIKAISLRYFNPIGSYSGEKFHDFLPKEKGTIMQEIIKSAIGINKAIEIYGNSYPTKDGTCERDFIHIDDLIDAHIQSIDSIESISGHQIYNVGTGNSISILELIENFINFNNININYTFAEKIPGDIHTSFADVSKINKGLNWQSKKTLKNMVEDSWRPFL